MTNKALDIINYINNKLSKKQVVILMSFLVGVFTAFAALILKTLIELMQDILTYSSDVTHINWLYLVSPAIGVLICALVIK